MIHFDALFRRLILTQTFVRGWGNPVHLQELCASRREKVANRDECSKLVPAESIQENTIEITKQETKGDRCYINGKFRSPMAIHHPNIVRKIIKFLFLINSIYVLYLNRFQLRLLHLIFNLFYQVIIDLVLIQFQLEFVMLEQVIKDILDEDF